MLGTQDRVVVAYSFVLVIRSSTALGILLDVLYHMENIFISCASG